MTTRTNGWLPTSSDSGVAWVKPTQEYVSKALLCDFIHLERCRDVFRKLPKSSSSSSFSSGLQTPKRADGAKYDRVYQLWLLRNRRGHSCIDAVTVIRCGAPWKLAEKERILAHPRLLLAVRASNHPVRNNAITASIKRLDAALPFPLGQTPQLYQIQLCLIFH